MTLFLVFLVAAFLLLVPVYIIYKPPEALIRYFEYRWPDVLWEIRTNKKIVALTIDDAPSQYTAEIQQVLEANNVTATFFVIGSQVPEHDDRLSDLVRAGNELGNHAMHDEPSRSLSDTELLAQMATVQTHIAEAYSKAGKAQPSTRFFRPGSGFFSTRMRESIAKIGYRLVLGGIYPHDPQIPYWKINARHILSMVRPGGIIICHDRREWTVPMLKEVLPKLKQGGYQVVDLSTLLHEAVTTVND